ncbi:MAG: hypothetical protein ACK5PW_05230 [Burkholderiales bacterium]|jgi:hypothetical protein
MSTSNTSTSKSRVICTIDYEREGKQSDVLSVPGAQRHVLAGDPVAVIVTPYRG